MKILLDEHMPHRVRQIFPDPANVYTVQHLHWEGLENGELLRRDAAYGFAAVVSTDGTMEREQRSRELVPLPVIILRIGRNRLQEITPHIPQVIRKLHSNPAPGFHYIDSRPDRLPSLRQSEHRSRQYPQYRIGAEDVHRVGPGDQV